MTYVPITGDLGLDDPGNASGLGAPAIIRGTVYGHLAAGVTVGSGQTTGVRQATATGLQNALNYAGTNNKFFELIPNVYEINSSTGLVTPAGSPLVWKGSRGSSTITQFYNGGTGAPVLSIGNSSTPTYNTEIDGVQLLYGVSQTGLTSASSLVINQVAWSAFKNININQGGGNSQYNSILFNTAPTFSCTFSDITAVSAQQNHMLINAGGSGNVFIDIDLTQGGIGTYNALAGNYINFTGSGGANEMTFIQLNLEWGSCNQPIVLAQNLGARFIGLHFEGINFTGSSPTAIAMSYSAVAIDTIDINDCLFRTANFTGTAALFSDFNSGYGSTIVVNNLTWTINSGAVNPGGAAEVDTTVLVLHELVSNPADYFTTLSIDKIYTADHVGGNLRPHVQFDTHTPVSSSAFIFPDICGGYSYGPGSSNIIEAQIVVSATYTHYGQYTDATIVVPASITSFTLTAAATMGATGTQKPKTGNTLHVRRQSGSAAGTLTVAYGGTSSPTVNTTAGQDFYYVFDGTTYQTFTPVT